MCTNYIAPGEDPGLSELRIDSFTDLYRWTPWKPEMNVETARAMLQLYPADEMVVEPK
ncbi:hypothetical protein [Burkholderia multivorans]|uniref:hypothetical protein n=1 Tax=Burkholderia multivorans TaxID=87883 RepID=UPI003BAD06C9